MEQFDICSSRSGLADTTVPITRGPVRLKRDTSDFDNDDLQITAAKMLRQSPPHHCEESNGQNPNKMHHPVDSSAMSVLPRLLRTMAATGGRDPPPGTVVTAATGSLPLIVSAAGHPVHHVNGGPVENGTHAAGASTLNDADSSSSSSSSSFISTPSSSSIISFLAPGQLGPVAAMAAAALSIPNTTTTSSTTACTTTSTLEEGTESSGLVTLATASSMFEKEWLARTAINHQEATGGHQQLQHVTSSHSDVMQQQLHHHHPQQLHSDMVTTTEQGLEQHISDNGSPPPLLLRTLTATSPNGQINGSNPAVTRAVLNVHNLAAFLRETQKQRSAPTMSIDMPHHSNVGTDEHLVTSYTDDVSLNHSAASSTVLTLAPSAMAHPSGHNAGTESVLMSNDDSTAPTDAGNTDPNGAVQPAAFISLQPAPGSLLSSSDLQQLVASGEFVTSAARQTLLGRSPDGATRQLYLLVPSDCPVIMSRASANSTTCSITAASGSSPMQDKLSSSTAPILEAISPGVETEDAHCHALPPSIPTADDSHLPVTVTLPHHLAGAMLTAPMGSSTSTALSTLIAGLEGRNQQASSHGIPRYHPQQQQQQQQQQLQTAVASSAWSNAQIVHTTDSARVMSRLPIHLPGVSLSEHNIISIDQSTGAYSTSTTNDINNMIGAVKCEADPDMYTPNGHPYPTLIDDVNRFRSHQTYSTAIANGVHELTVGTAARPTSLSVTTTTPVASATNSANFFQPDLSTSILLPQSTLLNTAATMNGTNGNGGSVTLSIMNNGNVNSTDAALSAAHMLPSPGLSRVNQSFNSNGGQQQTSPVGTSPNSLLTGNSKSMSGTSLEGCRRNMANTLLAAGASTRSDQGSATYLEHLNPETKDIRRRVSHNEVERRRRDRINTWISELYKLLPPDEQAKSQYQSKGIVLKRVCEYFQNVDSMLKAANAAVEQARVENNMLRQRNRELQQENQLLSASLHLGAAAAAVHLKNRQPRTALHTGLEELNGTVENHNNGNHNTGLVLKDANDQSQTSDYPTSVTVFTVNAAPNGSNDYGSNFSQQNTACMVPSAATASFAALTAPSCTSASNVFAIHASVPCSTMVTSTALNSISAAPGVTALVGTNGAPRIMTLPSLDLVANHTDGRTNE